MRLARTLGACALALLAGACGTTIPQRAVRDGPDACSHWFAQLDRAVDAAGTRDAQEERIEGFAGLRVDRFGQATRRLVAFETWVDRAAALDRDARDAELANLPRAAFPIDTATDAAAARDRSRQCRDALRARLLAADALTRDTLLQRATVPERYSTPARALGLYPLVRWPFLAGVQTWQSQQQHAFERWAAAPPQRMRFEPEGDAPLVFEIELQADGALAPFDRFGAPHWRAGQAAPVVDTTRPVVYRRRSHALHGARWLRQDVFTVWFPERPAKGRFDLLAGALDGLIVRLTYGPDGTPWLLDTIHACGCYHMFFPAEGIALRPGAPADEEWAFVPAALPRLAAGQRIAVRIASGSHYVNGVAASAATAAGAAQRYALRDEDALRSLPVAGSDAGRRSLYDADGLVAGTQRAERFLFWPMGIASAGAMRQWGHHATAFVGRRHFDDPNLLEMRFVLPDGLRP